MCRKLVTLLLLFGCSFLVPDEANAWHPDVQSLCKRADGKATVTFNWFGDGNTWTISAGNNGGTCKRNSSTITGSNCKNYFSPDPATRSGQPTVFPAGNQSNFFTATFTGSSLSWRVGPSTATATVKSTTPYCSNCTYVDKCGVCNGNNACLDCAGVPNGSAKKDKCGVCGGDNSSCTDCKGDVNGNAVVDSCGVCNGQNNTCLDCFGVPRGLGTLDLCGVCRAPGDPNVNSTCKDCAGIPGGTARLDNCGVCDSNPANDCTQDCLGTYGGQASVDACGVCNGGNNSCKDCAGTPNGSAQLDQCGVCNGTNACLDCAGTANGGTIVDDCGVCGGDGTSCKPECPKVAVDYNTIDLIQQASVIAYDKTIEYYNKGYVCTHKKIAKDIKAKAKTLASKIKALQKALLKGDPKKIAKAQAAVDKANVAYAAALAKDQLAPNKIETVKGILEEYIEIVNSLSTIIELCPGDCIDLHNKDKLDRMSFLVETLYTYASDAQHSYRGYCKVKGKGNPGTRPLADHLHGDISSCHGKDKVCK